LVGGAFLLGRQGREEGYVILLSGEYYPDEEMEAG
jgi:hypothetical protein